MTVTILLSISILGCLHFCQWISKSEQRSDWGEWVGLLTGKTVFTLKTGIS